MSKDNAETARTELLRHFLASLAYRARKTVLDAPENFPDFNVGGGVRTPVEILSHMSDVLNFLLNALKREHTSAARNVAGWSDEVERFNATLRALDVAFQSLENVTPERYERMLQGPLSDAMTHVGQLAMIRRLAGSPVPGESFFEADIQKGRFGDGS